MGAHAERNSPSWVCIPQKSLTITCDFWNINSLGWTLFCAGAHDGFSISFHSQVCDPFYKVFMGLLFNSFTYGSGHETVAVLLPGFAMIAKPGNKSYKTAAVPWPDPYYTLLFHENHLWDHVTICTCHDCWADRCSHTLTALTPVKYESELYSKNQSGTYAKFQISSAVMYLQLWNPKPCCPISGLILGLRPANERRRYFVTTSLIGWAQA